MGYTPLHWASRNGHLDVVKLLIEKDAQIDISSKVQEWVGYHAQCLSCSVLDGSFIYRKRETA